MNTLPGFSFLPLRDCLSHDFDQMLFKLDFWAASKSKAKQMMVLLTVFFSYLQWFICFSQSSYLILTAVWVGSAMGPVPAWEVVGEVPKFQMSFSFPLKMSPESVFFNPSGF